MTDPVGNIRSVPIEEELKTAYLDYAMSVIVGRALPDVRDGLKPVQRRILYTMNEMGLLAERPYRKCAAIVGDVMGKYHPHGDQAVYDALVRMAQDFSLRYPARRRPGQLRLGRRRPAPRRMRYTEARMTAIAAELLADIDKDTVDFVANYDGTRMEPAVLPGQAAQPAHQRLLRHRRRHGHQHPAPQPGRGRATPRRRSSTTRT